MALEHLRPDLSLELPVDAYAALEGHVVVEAREVLADDATAVVVVVVRPQLAAHVRLAAVLRLARVVGRES